MHSRGSLIALRRLLPLPLAMPLALPALLPPSLAAPKYCSPTHLIVEFAG